MFQREDLEFDNVKIHLMYYHHEFDIQTCFDDLTPKEIAFVQTYKSEKRRQEFVATRNLRTQLFGKKTIQYSEIGAPSILNEKYISISHSTDLIGIAVCEDFSIGFDLEPISTKVLRVKNKFLHEDEWHWHDCNNPVEVTKIWSAKEALYKLVQQQGILFSQDLKLEPTKDKTIYLGHIQRNSQWKIVALKAIEYKGSIICSTIAPLDI